MNRGLSDKEEQEVYELAAALNQWFRRRKPKQWQAIYAMTAIIAGLIAEESVGPRDAAERAEMISNLLHQETVDSILVRH